MIYFLDTDRSYCQDLALKLCEHIHESFYYCEDAEQLALYAHPGDLIIYTPEHYPDLDLQPSTYRLLKLHAAMPHLSQQPARILHPSGQMSRLEQASFTLCYRYDSPDRILEHIKQLLPESQDQPFSPKQRVIVLIGNIDEHKSDHYLDLFLKHAAQNKRSFIYAPLMPPERIRQDMPKPDRYSLSDVLSLQFCSEMKTKEQSAASNKNKLKHSLSHKESSILLSLPQRHAFCLNRFHSGDDLYELQDTDYQKIMELIRGCVYEKSTDILFDLRYDCPQRAKVLFSQADLIVLPLARDPRHEAIRLHLLSMLKKWGPAYQQKLVPELSDSFWGPKTQPEILRLNKQALSSEEAPSRKRLFPDEQNPKLSARPSAPTQQKPSRSKPQKVAPPKLSASGFLATKRPHSTGRFNPFRHRRSQS